MTGIDNSWVETIIKKNERENQIAKVVDIQYASPVPKGENYSSLILRATMDVILGSGRRTKKYAIIKKELKGKSADILKEIAGFKGEIKTYSEILKPMEALMDEFQDKNDLLWGRLFGFNAYDMIMLSDLSSEGYVVANRRECLDLNHGFLVLKSLGRMHAMSKILMERCLVTDQEVRPYYLSHNNSPFVKNLMEGTMNQLSNAITTHWPSEWREIGERLLEVKNFVCEKLKSLIDYDGDDLFTVVNHGDLWTCNIMFKYSDGDPIGVKFIDFQQSHINSYAWDLLYFIHTSIRPEIRRKHFYELSEAYLDSLTSTLRFYGYDKKIPNSEELKKELERMEFFSFVILALVHPAMTADSNNAFDLEKLDGGNSMNPDIMITPKCINAIGNDLKDYFKRGVI